MRNLFEQAGNGIERIIAGSVRRVPAGQGPLVAWSLACGSKVSQRTRAVDFAEGVLSVEVPDSGWRTELKVLAPHYVAAVNRYATERVRRIEFLVSKQKASA